MQQSPVPVAGPIQSRITAPGSPPTPENAMEQGPYGALQTFHWPNLAHENNAQAARAESTTTVQINGDTPLQRLAERSTTFALGASVADFQKVEFVEDFVCPCDCAAFRFQN